MVWIGMIKTVNWAQHLFKFKQLIEIYRPIIDVDPKSDVK